jgi:hypothetical protein
VFCYVPLAPASEHKPARGRLPVRTDSALSNLLRHGHVTPPVKDSSGDYVWTDADLERVRAVLAARHNRRPEGGAAHA